MDGAKEPLAMSWVFSAMSFALADQAQWQEVVEKARLSSDGVGLSPQQLRFQMAPRPPELLVYC